MLEKIDRDEVMNMGRTGAKLTIVSLIVSGVLNRGLTLCKFGNRDFLNLHWIMRVPIRLSIFALSFVFITYMPMFNHYLKLRQYFNKKYTARLIKYNREMDPLIMNPQMINEPGMTDEEREYMRVFYENMKSQGAMMKAQMKMMEQSGKR